MKGFCLGTGFFITMLSGVAEQAIEAKGIIYLECKEEVGVIEETVNISTMGSKGIETSHHPTKRLLPKSGLLNHKVSLNPEKGTGSWRNDASPRYLPTHIVFNDGEYPDSTILKIWRKESKESKGIVAFERIKMVHTTTPFPIKKDWYLWVGATGKCTFVKAPSGNLF